jgi:protein TonB
MTDPVVADYENTVVNSTSLDNLPDFPRRRFHTYIGKNFDTSEINGEKDIRIYVSFVVEKDGKLTDIQVKNDPSYVLEYEAIRVLKSLKQNGFQENQLKASTNFLQIAHHITND